MKIIGIDPDISKCGVCELVNGKIIALKSIPVPELLSNIAQWHESGYKFALENVEMNTFLYGRNNKGNALVNRKIMLNVGKMQGVARIISEYIKYTTGEDVILTPPGIGRNVKKNARLFKSITGWEGRTNEDMRDAAMIAIHTNKLLQSAK